MSGDELATWAEQEASALLSELGDRWGHVRAVARTAMEVGRVLHPQDRAVLMAAAYLHDVGYAPPLNRLGFHAVDGARYLRDQGQERLASLVAYHSGAWFEAEERGLTEELASFQPEDGPVMDALTFVDMTTGPAGQPTSLDERVAEIVMRYPPDDPVHRAIVRAQAFLQGAVERTLERLQHAANQPM